MRGPHWIQHWRGCCHLNRKHTHTHKVSVNTCFPPLVQTVDVLKSPSMTQLIIPLLSTPEPSLHSASQEPCYLLLYMRHGEGHKVNTNERASWHNNRKASSARLFISLPWGTLCKLLLYVLGFINWATWMFISIIWLECNEDLPSITNQQNQE